MSHLIERAVVKPLRWSSSRVFGHHKMRGSSPFGEWDAFDIEDMSEAQIDARKAEAQRRYEASFLSGVEPASPSPVAAGGTDLDHVTALDRLRLHVHDPETFAFDYDDCVSLEEQIDAMLSARPSIGETVPGAGWQPIETVPKGVEVDVWLWEVGDNGRPLDGFRWASVRVVGAVPYTIIHEEPDGALVSYNPSENGQFISDWMPVPASPPLASTQEGEVP